MAIRIWKHEKTVLDIILDWINKQPIPDVYYINIKNAVNRRSNEGYLIPNDARLSGIPRKDYCCFSCLVADFRLKHQQLKNMQEENRRD